MKLLKTQKISEFIENFDDCAHDKEYFKNDYFNNFTNNISFLKDKCKDKYLCISHQTLNPKEKYKFYGCSGLYRRNLTLNNQVRVS